MTSFFFSYVVTRSNTCMQNYTENFFNNHVYDIFTMYSTHDLFNQYSKKFNEKESKYFDILKEMNRKFY